MNLRAEKGHRCGHFSASSFQIESFVFLIVTLFPSLCRNKPEDFCLCFMLLLNLVQFCIRKFYFQVTFVVKAVSAFSAAVFLVQVEKCQGHNLSECLRTSDINLQQEILSMLSQLSFTSQHKAPFELQGTSIHVTHDGQLISNKYIIFHIRDTGDVSGVSCNCMCSIYFMAWSCLKNYIFVHPTIQNDLGILV
jgi:hypothetical protein